LRISTFFQSVIDWDESVYLLMSKSILDGNLPYIQVWDHKPPDIIRVGVDQDAWDYDAVYKPFAMHDDGRWLLWYNGRRKRVEQIGLALFEGDEVWTAISRPS